MKLLTLIVHTNAQQELSDLLHKMDQIKIITSQVKVFTGSCPSKREDISCERFKS